MAEHGEVNYRMNEIRLVCGVDWKPCEEDWLDCRDCKRSVRRDRDMREKVET